MRPRCTGCDQGDTIGISVYRKPSTAQNHAKLSLREDLIHWLLSYAAGEMHFQGVVCVREEPERELGMECNCTAVADVHLEWHVGERAWGAEFVSGPFSGTTRRFCVANLTTER